MGSGFDFGICCENCWYMRDSMLQAVLPARNSSHLLNNADSSTAIVPRIAKGAQ